MTSTLLLKLGGPLQSWGANSTHGRRETEPHPTKSGILGLVAAAQGRERDADLEDLAALRFAVRVDQAGSRLHDYQTAQATGGGTRLISRYYLTDAVFVAAVESADREVLEGVVSALEAPAFPLFLGRRSCPVNPDLVLGVQDTDLLSALRNVAWQASVRHRKSQPAEVVLPVFRDARPSEERNGRAVRDLPRSFNQVHRKYEWRTVVQDRDGVPVTNQLSTQPSDPFFEAVASA